MPRQPWKCLKSIYFSISNLKVHWHLRAASLLTAWMVSLQSSGPSTTYSASEPTQELTLPISPSSNIHGVRLKVTHISRIRISPPTESNSIVLASEGIFLFLLWELVSCKIEIRNSMLYQLLSSLSMAGGCSESAPSIWGQRAQSVSRFLSAPL